MSRRQTIETKIIAGLSPLHLEVIDESHMHAVPPGAESHFKLIVVAERFAGEPLIRRHQRVNAILAEELNGGLHALSLQTLTAEECLTIEITEGSTGPIQDHVVLSRAMLLKK